MRDRSIASILCILCILGACIACGGGGGKGVPTPPAAPGGVAAVAGNARIGIAWNAAAEATSYNLYWSANPGVTKGNGTKISGVTSPYEHTGLTNDRRYHYVITAVGAGGESGESAEVSAIPNALTPPPAPTGITVNTGETQVILRWNPVAESGYENAEAGVTYNLYWAPQAGVRKTTGAKIAGVASPYAHTGLTTDQAYHYVLTSVNAYGEGIESAEVKAVPQPGTIPPAPSGCKASVYRDRITLEWNPSQNAAYYNVYWSNRSDVSVQKGTKISNATSPYLHEGLAKGQTYYYIVTAVNASGESLPSAVVSATVTDWLEDIVVAMGDSITAGYGVDPPQCYVPILSGLIGKTVVNEGVDGERSDGGANRIAGVLARYNPKVVTVYYGNNDVGIYPLNWTIGHLYNILRACQDYGTTPVIATIGPQFGQWAWRRPYIIEMNQRIRQLAGDMQVRVVDLEASLNWNQGYIGDDGLHPNANGHNVIANTFKNGIP